MCLSDMPWCRQGCRVIHARLTSVHLRDRLPFPPAALGIHGFHYGQQAQRRHFGVVLLRAEEDVDYLPTHKQVVTTLVNEGVIKNLSLSLSLSLSLHPLISPVNLS